MVEKSSLERRGFARLSPERRRELAVQGGRAVQAQGTGHLWTTAEAREAGRKGGNALWAKRRPNRKP